MRKNQNEVKIDYTPENHCLQSLTSIISKWFLPKPNSLFSYIFGVFALTSGSWTLLSRKIKEINEVTQCVKWTIFALFWSVSKFFV